MSSSSSSSGGDSDADSDSDSDDDLFYAPSYKNRRKEREESARRDFSLEDNNNDNTSSEDDEEDGDGNDDGKKRKSGGEREEKERKRRCLMSDDEEEAKEKEATARVGAETKVSDSDSDGDDDDDAKAASGEKTEREKYNDDKLREASALMRELTKKTDAREFEDDEGFVVDDDDDDNNNNDGTRVSDVNNADADDLVRYEPIQLVFAFSNTNKVEFETSKRYTFERIWKDFVNEHQPKGDIAKAKLTFDGDRIKVSEDTPESLDMDDEDVVDCVML